VRPPYGAGAPNVVRHETRVRLTGRRGELEPRLAGLLVRMTAGERRAFWLGVMLTDESVDHRQALAAWVRRLDPALAEVLVDLPAAPELRPPAASSSSSCGYCGGPVAKPPRGRTPKVCKADACQARRRAGEPLPQADRRPLVEV
jgi:hypothetical protein